MQQLALALVKAQAAFKPIVRDKTVTVRTRTGGVYTFAYAPLDSIMSSIKEALAVNEIALLQDVRDGKVVTILAHSSGDIYTSTGTPIKVMEEGAQAYSSGLSYARRYDLSLTLGICPGDDDDGNAADGNTASPAALKATITPTTGVWDHISAERSELLHRIASGVIDFFSSNEPEKAFAYLSDQVKDNEEKAAIWTCFDSKQRAALKKMAAQKLATEQA